MTASIQEYPHKPRRISILSEIQLAKRVFEATSEVTGTSVKEFLSPDRTKYTADARHLAAYVLRTKYDMSLAEIASLLKRRDHSTIVSSMRRVEKDWEYYEPYLVEIDSKLEELKTQA